MMMPTSGLLLLGTARSFENAFLESTNEHGLTQMKDKNASQSSVR
jgi:hypothetical protein